MNPKPSVCSTKWIHCNNCFYQWDNSRKMYLLSCKHVTCQQCLFREGRSKCSKCKIDVGKLEISKSMDSKYLDFFKTELYSTLNTTFEKLLFQHKQVLNWVKYLQELETKMNHVKVVTQRYDTKIKAITPHYEKLRAYRIQLQQKIRSQENLTFQSPNSDPSSSLSFFNKRRGAQDVFNTTTPTSNQSQPTNSARSSNASSIQASSRTSAESFFQNKNPRSTNKPDYGIVRGKGTAQFFRKFPDGR